MDRELDEPVKPIKRFGNTKRRFDKSHMISPGGKMPPSLSGQDARRHIPEAVLVLA